MLLGEHEHTIDDKNRLTLPARFRHHFAEGIVVTRGMDGCLYAYTRPEWTRLVEHTHPGYVSFTASLPSFAAAFGLAALAALRYRRPGLVFARA